MCVLPHVFRSVLTDRDQIEHATKLGQGSAHREVVFTDIVTHAQVIEISSLSPIRQGNIHS